MGASSSSFATYTTPTLSELLTQAQADINSELPGGDALLTYSVLNVLSVVLAGEAFDLYGFLTFISLQAFPDTAESAQLYHWGSIWGLIPEAAQAASGTVTVTGSNGVTIPVGTQFIRADNIVFESTTAETIASGTATIPVVALLPGSTTNTVSGTSLTLTNPIAFVSATSTVTSDSLIGGTDTETDQAYLTRLLFRIQNPPQGGSATDYIQWATSQPGVTRAWCTQELGAGTVTVRFMMDNTYSDGIPHSGDVTNVYNALTLLRPVTAQLFVFAPTANPLNFTIHLNIANTAAIQAAVQASLQEMILSYGSPGGTIYLSQINEAIATATGVYDFTLSSPSANVVQSTGNIPTFGSITWV